MENFETIQLESLESNSFYYNWSIVYSPEGSSTEISNSHIANPTISIDAEGCYIISLVVTYENQNTNPSYVYFWTRSVSHHIRSDASGNNDGSDWDHAWTDLPPILERGHAYYLADGTYNEYCFNDEEHPELSGINCLLQGKACACYL